MTEKERARQLASEHIKYVRGLLISNGVEGDLIESVAYNYTTAFEHAYGHAIEDERNGLFRPSIGEPLTTEEVTAIAGPCGNCLDSFTCDGSFRNVNGECLHQRPRDGK